MMSDAINKPAHYNQGSIECIDAMKIVLTPEEFRGYLKGNVFKYLWREKDKNGNEDLRKGKSYYDRLIELIDESEQQKAADLQSLKDHPFGKMKEQPSTTQSPDGWRWLEVGEVLRRGDTTNTIDEIPEDWIGIKCAVKHNLLRRNRFEVGEKVVHDDDKEPIPYDIDEYIYSKDAYIVKYKDGHYMYHPSKLAPYIEESK